MSAGTGLEVLTGPEYTAGGEVQGSMQGLAVVVGFLPR